MTIHVRILKAICSCIELEPMTCNFTEEAGNFTDDSEEKPEANSHLWITLVLVTGTGLLTIPPTRNLSGYFIDFFSMNNKNFIIIINWEKLRLDKCFLIYSEIFFLISSKIGELIFLFTFWFTFTRLYWSKRKNIYLNW